MPKRGRHPHYPSATCLRSMQSHWISTGMNKDQHLIADIGGTHARFALCTSVSDIRNISVMKTADFPTFELVVRHYLESVGNPRIDTAVIGIANPILGDHIKMTNSPWEF